jgi:hypothetical protein
MNSKLQLSLLASMVVANTVMADNLSALVDGGKVSGQFREFSITRAYNDTHAVANNDYTRKANAMGGYLKYETGAWNGVSLGVAAYATVGFGLGDRPDLRQVDPTLLSNNNTNDLYIGEAYLNYKNGNTNFKAGRQKLDTPMAGSDDARMLPNLFEAYVLSNSDIKDTTLIAAHVTSFSQGTFGRVYDANASAGNAVLSATSGYSYWDSRNQTGTFTNMGKYAINRNTEGVSVLAATYSGIAGLKLQLWDYYAHDILNLIYAEGNYGLSLSNGLSPYIAAQYIKENGVGGKYAGNVKSDFVAGKVGVKVANFDFYGALSHNSKDASATINGGTLSPWGGSPAYTQGMVSRHQFMAGTDAWKLSGGYDWKNFGINLNTSAFYASYKMDSLNGYSTNYAWTAKEYGADVIFTPQTVKNLQFRLRANHAGDFYANATGTVTWDEYRFIINYNF